MKITHRLLLQLLASLLLLMSLATAQAGIEVRKFDNPQQEELYDQLMYELRCLVCQNENLAASNADLAKDLRDEVYDMITQKGLGEKEIKDFLIQRYGNFVLYKPPVEKTTWLLWFGPFLFLLLGILVLLFVLRNNRKQPVTKLDEGERKKVRDLLESEDK
jgi:cytochrome c-type biogenesis protein CcmH